MHSSLVSRRIVQLVIGLGMGLLGACTVEDPEVTSPGTAGSAGQGQSGAGTTGQAGMPGSSGSGGGTSPSSGSGGSATAGSSGSGGTSAGGASGGSGGSGVSGGPGGGSAGAGGSGGVGGGGGSGGTPAFNPCPTNGDACRIMPLGDSITDGAGSSHGASYRLELFRLSLMNNKKLTFVGSHESGPNMVDNVAFPKKQEGHSGWTIDDGGGRSGLYPKMQEWLTAQPPHIVTLMIGTNDVDINLDVANAPKRLGLLLDRIIQYAPNALIVVAQMVPTTDDTENQRVMAYNNAIPDQVKTRADAGKHVTMVDMYAGFTKNANYKTEYMNDKLHPKDAGYVVMANIWWAKVGPLLPAK
jgi:lysophospholipase L1-like esterase